jgi:hypothetical protein
MPFLFNASCDIQTVVALTADEPFRAKIRRSDPGGHENGIPQQQI